MFAAIYLRLSRDEEQKGIEEILKTHRKSLIKLATREKLKYEIFEEISSGKNNERPELKKLLDRIAEFDYVLVMDQDRLTRDNIFALELKQEFIVNDIKILTPSGAIDFENESDELSYSFKSMLAEYEWKSIRKRMGRGRLAAAAEGKWVGSNRVPLGYKKDENKRLVIVEDEAKIIRFIFGKILEGYSAHRISQELDLLGWRTRQGKVITTSHISVFRKNPVYYGCVSMKRRANGKVVDDVFVENAHEAIISKEDFLKVQNVIEGKSKGFVFRQRGSITRLLQGLIYCNCCGRKRYITDDGTGTDFIKTCSYKVDNNKCDDKGYKYIPIEEAVIEDVKAMKEDIKRELKQLETEDTTEIEKNLNEQKSGLERGLAKIINRRKNLTIMRSDGEITKQEFEELKEEADKQIGQLEKQIELVSLQVEKLGNTEEEQNRLKRVINYIDRFDELEIEEANSFLKSIIKKVRFSSKVASSHNTKDEKPDPDIIVEYY